MVRLLSMALPAAFILAGATLALSLVAAALAVRAIRSAQALATDVGRLSASMEVALSRSLAQRATTERPAPLAIPKPRTTLLAPPPSPAVAGPLAESRCNVVRLPDLSAGRRQAEAEAVRSALAGATPHGRAEFSLQPIVSVSAGKVEGFDVLRLFRRPRLEPLVVRRIVAPPAGFDLAAYERHAIMAAFDAGGNELAGLCDGPLHVAISDALLDTRRELDVVVAAAHEDPAFRAAIVLCVNARFLACTRLLPALAELAEAGIGLCAEAEATLPVGTLAGAPLRYIRAPAARLVGPDKPRPGQVARFLGTVAEAGAPLVATGVESDDEVMALLDLGIDLMMGDRFSEAERRTARQGGEPLGG